MGLAEGGGEATKCAPVLWLWTQPPSRAMSACVMPPCAQLPAPRQQCGVLPPPSQCVGTFPTKDDTLPMQGLPAADQEALREQNDKALAPTAGTAAFAVTKASQPVACTWHAHAVLCFVSAWQALHQHIMVHPCCGMAGTRHDMPWQAMPCHCWHATTWHRPCPPP